LLHIPVQGLSLAVLILSFKIRRTREFNRLVTTCTGLEMLRQQMVEPVSQAMGGISDAARGGTLNGVTPGGCSAAHE
jgi:hypothetical protein